MRNQTQKRKNMAFIKNFLAIIIISISFNSFGQKNEFKAYIDSGLFSFAGESANKYSQINLYSNSNTGYTNNPYGSKNGACLGFSLSFERISKKHTIYGITLGFENLKSKVEINSVNGYNGFLSFQKEANGQTYLKINSININPFFGHRFSLNKTPIDLVGGFDIKNILSTNENGNATSLDGARYETSLERKTIKLDFAPRIQIATEYNKFGVYFGYSFGLRNYLEGYIGGNPSAYSKMLRFGISYKIKYLASHNSLATLRILY